MSTRRLGFVGTGAISSAIVKGLAGSSLKDWPIAVSPRSRDRAEELASTVASVSVATDNQAVVDQSDIVFLAVRPQIAAEVLQSLKFRDGQSVISLVAGMQVSTISDLIKTRVDITRAIPLPSVEQRACVTPIMPPSAEASEIFDALGSTIQISDPGIFEGYVAGSAVMATYFGIVKVVGDWLCRNGLNENDADIYLRHLFGNLGDILRARPELDLDELRADHTTIGGLNEMVHMHFVKNGGPGALESGLDAVLARVRAQST